MSHSPYAARALAKRGWEGDYELSINRVLSKASDFSNRSNPTDWKSVEKLLLRALEEVRQNMEHASNENVHNMNLGEYADKPIT